MFIISYKQRKKSIWKNINLPHFLFYHPFRTNFFHPPELCQILERSMSPPLIKGWRGGWFHTMHNLGLSDV